MFIEKWGVYTRNRISEAALTEWHYCVTNSAKYQEMLAHKPWLLLPGGYDVAIEILIRNSAQTHHLIVIEMATATRSELCKNISASGFRPWWKAAVWEVAENRKFKYGTERKVQEPQVTYRYPAILSKGKVSSINCWGVPIILNPAFLWLFKTKDSQKCSKTGNDTALIRRLESTFEGRVSILMQAIITQLYGIMFLGFFYVDHVFLWSTLQDFCTSSWCVWM